MEAAGVGEREVVLVTGFPRQIARLVVEQLVVAAPHRDVRVLVRERYRADADAWLRTVRGRERVSLIEGDVSAIDLGLSGREFNDLAAELTHIQHHAAVAHDGAERKVAEAVNVQGTREVLELARAAPHLVRLVHASTATVSGDRTGLVREDELDVGQRFRTPVEETRFRAEQLMQRATTSLPVTVLRPSLVVGHSETGEVDRLDGPYLLVLLMLNSPTEIAMPLLARGDAALNLVPVDFVARASVALMNDPGAVGRTLHLVDPVPLDARRVYELIASIAGRKVPRGFIPVHLTRALLRTPGLDRFVKSPRAFLDQLATPVTWSSNGARDLLVPHGVECPGFESYAETLVSHVRDRLAARRAAQRAQPLTEVDDPLA